MQLSDLINGLQYRVRQFRDVDVRALEFDSRQVKPGALFIALAGDRVDGHGFVEAARQAGACAAVTQREVDSPLPQVIVGDTRAAMGRLARKYYYPAEKVNVYGITGTNGKTTTAFLMHSILAAAGRQPALIGTIYYMGKSKIKAQRTTPESLDIFKLIDRFYHEGSRDVVMEVSSHALSLKRVDEIRFDAAIFTNLSQDHLDFHRTVEAYRDAKMRIFSLLGDDGWAVYNADDPAGAEIAEQDVRNKMSYGFDKKAAVSGRLLEHTLAGMKVAVTYQGGEHIVRSKLIGEYNVYNIVAAYAAGVALAIEPAPIIDGIEGLTAIRGRMELAAPGIFVDFAHTPKALASALATLRRFAAARLIVVFGCGGDRDREKRPIMGRVASETADLVFVTSDNPRRESPLVIIEEIKKGIVGDRYEVVPDRKEAIRRALAAMGPEDLLLIAGKGHEEEQLINDCAIEFDDVRIVGELRREMMNGSVNE